MTSPTADRKVWYIPSTSLQGQLHVVHFNCDILAIYYSAKASNAMCGIKCLC